MSESKKLLIAFAVIGVICICIAGISFVAFRSFGKGIENAVSGNPTSVAKAQEKIAEFDIPPGYEPMAMSMFIYDIVYLTPAEDSGTDPMIMLMQYSKFSLGDSEQMAEQLRQAAEQQTDQPGLSMEKVDAFEEVIRGQTVTVTVSEANYQGFTMRQWVTIFQGNNGPVILMIQGIVETWDDQLVHDFIKSIK